MQFGETKGKQALELIESLAWGDIEMAIYAFEVALALALEAVGPDSIGLWEAEGEERFGDEFELSVEDVVALDDDLRLAYIARLLYTAACMYGVNPSNAVPGRSPEGEVTSPLTWGDDVDSFAELLRGLNDIRYGIYTCRRH